MTVMLQSADVLLNGRPRVEGQDRMNRSELNSYMPKPELEVFERILRLTDFSRYFSGGNVVSRARLFVRGPIGENSACWVVGFWLTPGGISTHLKPPLQAMPETRRLAGL